MTTLYLDTEFNSFGGPLISMALVGLSGNEWYGVFPLPETLHPWVNKHVIPVLDVVPGVCNKLNLRGSFLSFMMEYHNPEIVCDWFEDAKHFFAMFAGNDYGSSFAYECRLTLVNTPPGQPVSDVPHNALADARALRHWHSNI